MAFFYKNNKIVKIVVISLFVLGMPLLGFAQVEYDPYQTYETGAGTDALQQETGLGNAQPVEVASNIINVALGLLGLFSLAMILYGGYIWMNARGNEEQVGKAKKLLTGAIIGLVIILASYGIANFIFFNVQRTTDVEALNP